LAEEYCLPIEMLVARVEGELAFRQRKELADCPYPIIMEDFEPTARLLAAEWRYGFAAASNRFLADAELSRKRFKMVRPAIRTEENVLKQIETLRLQFENVDEAVQYAFSQIAEPQYLKSVIQLRPPYTFACVGFGDVPPLHYNWRFKNEEIFIESIAR
jgi:hypothetical protein